MRGLGPVIPLNCSTHSVLGLTLGDHRLQQTSSNASNNCPLTVLDNDGASESLSRRVRQTVTVLWDPGTISSSANANLLEPGSIPDSIVAEGSTRHSTTPSSLSPQHKIYRYLKKSLVNTTEIPREDASESTKRPLGPHLLGPRVSLLLLFSLLFALFVHLFAAACVTFTAACVPLGALLLLFVLLLLSLLLFLLLFLFVLLFVLFLLFVLLLFAVFFETKNENLYWKRPLQNKTHVPHETTHESAPQLTLTFRLSEPVASPPAWKARHRLCPTRTL